MTMLATCPDAASLERFLLGGVLAGERDQLEAHLLTCAACSNAVELVTAEDTLVEAVRRLADNEIVPETPVLRDLIERARQLRATAEPATLSQDDPLTPLPPATAPEFLFLAPPQ